MKMKETNMKMNAYVVCAKPRVVLFGYASTVEIAKPHPKLRNARMCVYWNEDVHGVLGLASNGPSRNCRVTPPVPELTVRESVEATLLCSRPAVEAWESEPWK